MLMNPSLNVNLLKFLLCVGLYWKAVEGLEDLKVLKDSIEPIDFSSRGYLPLFQSHWVTHKHGLAVYMRRVFFYLETYPYKTLRILIYVFNCLYFIWCLTSFPSWNYPLFFVQMFWCCVMEHDEGHYLFCVTQWLQSLSIS